MKFVPRFEYSILNHMISDISGTVSGINNPLHNNIFNRGFLIHYTIFAYKNCRMQPATTISCTVCVNQAHNSPTTLSTTCASCVLDFHKQFKL